MGIRLIMMLMVTALLAVLSVNRIGVIVVSAQAGNETSSRGVLGDVLDAVKLQGLVENIYAFRNRVADRGGLDSEFLNWLTPMYSGFSKSLLGFPIWPIIRFIALPAAIAISTCLPLYPQTGILGVVLTAGFLTGLIYMLPLFLIIEVFSKTGLVATHSKMMLKMLLILIVVSDLCLLFAHATHNVQVLFSCYVMFFATTLFAWFLPILLYYRG